MLKNNINTLLKKIEYKTKINIFLIIYHKKTNTLLNKTIHITLQWMKPQSLSYMCHETHPIT